MVHPDRPQMTIWYSACALHTLYLLLQTRTRNTLTFNVFPLQQLVTLKCFNITLNVHCCIKCIVQIFSLFQLIKPTPRGSQCSKRFVFMKHGRSTHASVGIAAANFFITFFICMQEGDIFCPTTYTDRFSKKREYSVQLLSYDILCAVQRAEGNQCKGYVLTKYIEV